MVPEVIIGNRLSSRLLLLKDTVCEHDLPAQESRAHAMRGARVNVHVACFLKEPCGRIRL